MNKTQIVKWKKEGNVLIDVCSKNQSLVYVFWGPRAGIYISNRDATTKKTYRIIKEPLKREMFRKLSIIDNEIKWWPSIAIKLTSFIKKSDAISRFLIVRKLWKDAMNAIPPMVRYILYLTKNNFEEVYAFLRSHSEIANLPMTEKNKYIAKSVILEKVFYMLPYALAKFNIRDQRKLVNTIYFLANQRYNLKVSSFTYKNLSILCRLPFVRFRCVYNSIISLHGDLDRLEDYVKEHHLIDRLDHEIFKFISEHKSSLILLKVKPQLEWLEEGLHILKDERLPYIFCGDKRPRKSIYLGTNLDYLEFLMNPEACAQCQQLHQEHRDSEEEEAKMGRKTLKSLLYDDTFSDSFLMKSLI